MRSDYGPSASDLGWGPEDCNPEHPPCKRCNGPNDMADVCAKCGEELKAEGYDPFFTSKYSDNGRD